MRPAITLCEFDLPNTGGKILINLSEIQCIYEVYGKGYARIQLKNFDVSVSQTYEQVKELLTNANFLGVNL